MAKWKLKGLGSGALHWYAGARKRVHRDEFREVEGRHGLNAVFGIALHGMAWHGFDSCDGCEAMALCVWLGEELGLGDDMGKCTFVELV